MPGDLTEKLRAAFGRSRGKLAAAHFNIGTLCRKAGRLDEARVALHDALAAAPDDPDVHVNLATVYEDQGRLEDAVSHNRGALKLDPNHVHALKNLANVLGMQGKLDEAIANYERVLDLKPDHYQALSELAYQRQRACSWDGIEALWKRLRREAIGVDSEVSFSVWSFTTSAQEQLACATAWALRNFTPYARARSRLAFDFSARSPRARLRIGYLSWDFRQHPLSCLIAELFELHDRGRFEITAYSLGPDDGSAIRGRIKSGCDRFVDVSREPDIDVARRIYADGIDILVDLQGYTTGSRSPIIALRPAPVQVNWLGHPGTMGTDCIDYIIADPFIIPEGMARCYAEKVVWMPDCYQINDRRRGVSGRKPLAEYLAQYRVADLALDTFPYTSHTTASDALWMGCPLVTRTGETFASRVAGSILINAGMRELVTENLDDYERKVLDLAASPGKLQEIRRRLQEGRDSCPLFDTPRFVGNLESAYETMVSAHTRGKG